MVTKPRSWWMRALPGAVLALLMSLLTGGRGVADERRGERSDRAPAIVATTVAARIACVPACGLAALIAVRTSVSQPFAWQAPVVVPTIRCGSALGARAPTI